jgi:hypothetical protein
MIHIQSIQFHHLHHQETATAAAAAVPNIMELHYGRHILEAVSTRSQGASLLH